MKRLALIAVLLIFSIDHKVFGEEINQSLITDYVLKGASGITGINMASGDDHVQSNMWIIGIESLNRGFINQETVCKSEVPDKAMDKIGDNAFSDIKGIFSINQASGSGNAEANLVSISVGKKINTSDLGQNVAKIKNKSLYSGEFSDIISDSAFSGARGLVQVNQSAGIGNGIANNFHLNFNRATLK
ncbi:MAG: hypothetical protein H0Z16_07515 [Thermodesulfobacterium sp.]|nr:hypothetical protein [Thermodesulfobacterium sp.]